MTLVLTMMVRDEADIIASTIEHHLSQGVDRIIVTDNGSVDGTSEILERYAAVAPLTLMVDREHRMDQGRIVTKMARLAHDEYRADWVVNGDADEFVMARDAALSLRDVFERLPKEIGAFNVPVTNLVGPMGRRGSGVRRLVWRDLRSEEQLRDAGIFAQPTPNAIHVGAADVTVGEGNHTTSIEPVGPVPPGLELEVLHLPWRSVGQLKRKTENQGRGFEASPHLNPSPKHHGMRDWRRLKAGVLDEFFALRTPTTAELAAGGFAFDATLRDGLEQLIGRCRIPELLSSSIDDRDDAPFTDDELRSMRTVARAVRKAEEPLYEELTGLRLHADLLEQDRDRIRAERDDFERRLHVVQQQLADGAADAARTAEDLRQLEAEYQAVRQQLDRIERHPVVRTARAMRRVVRRR